MEHLGKKLNNSKGFTLIELMVAVGVIGILVSVAVPNYQSYVYKSRTAEAKIRIGELRTAIYAHLSEYTFGAGELG